MPLTIALDCRPPSQTDMPTPTSSFIIHPSSFIIHNRGIMTNLTEPAINLLAAELSRIPLLADEGRRLDVVERLPAYFREQLGAYTSGANSQLAQWVRVAAEYPADGPGLLFRAIAAIERAEAADPDRWQSSQPLTAAETLWADLAARAGRGEPASPRLGIRAEGQGRITISGNVAVGDIHQVNIHPQQIYERYQAIDPAEAQATLARMPLDERPDYSELPPWSLLPYGRNPNFVGREATLRALAQALKEGEAQTPPLAIVAGMGGLGKTQAAVEFAHRYGPFFAGGVFWLNCADAANIEAELVRCGGPEGLALPAFEALAFSDKVGRVRREWESGLPRLLIFDNCEDPALLEQWRPKRGGSRVLVTSRRGDWTALTTTPLTLLPLALLTVNESRALLGRLAAHLTETEQDQIAHTLDYHPLALHVAGSYLAANRDDYPAADFLAAVEQEALQEEALAQSREALHLPGNHTPHLYATFALSYLQLDSRRPADHLAQLALLHAALLAPGAPLPDWLLGQTLLARAEAGLPAREEVQRRIEDHSFEANDESTPSQPPPFDKLRTQPARGRSQHLPPSGGDRGGENRVETKLSASELEDERAERKARRQIKQAITRLGQLGLIEQTGEVLRLHRLIGAFSLERAGRLRRAG
ncbi:MAG: hypothetical protein H6632_19045 [Anaerolineales bacterium]|nr:hypothetical protein [Anaerolineales bacterium]